MSRPTTPLEVAESQRLHRVASLASAVMGSLRQHERGRFSSSRQLAGWLAADSISFRLRIYRRRSSFSVLSVFSVGRWSVLASRGLGGLLSGLAYTSTSVHRR
jgi:hypothetical protein